MGEEGARALWGKRAVVPAPAPCPPRSSRGRRGPAADSPGGQREWKLQTLRNCGRIRQENECERRRGACGPVRIKRACARQSANQVRPPADSARRNGSADPAPLTCAPPAAETIAEPVLASPGSVLASNGGTEARTPRICAGGGGSEWPEDPDGRLGISLMLVLENSSASHYNDVCKPVSVCALLRIENVGRTVGQRSSPGDPKMPCSRQPRSRDPPREYSKSN